MYADSMENLYLVLGSKRVQGQCHSFTADHVHSILYTGTWSLYCSFLYMVGISVYLVKLFLIYSSIKNAVNANIKKTTPPIIVTGR